MHCVFRQGQRGAAHSRFLRVAGGSDFGPFINNMRTKRVLALVHGIRRGPEPADTCGRFPSRCGDLRYVRARTSAA
jgi:hypothetical protein